MIQLELDSTGQTFGVIAGKRMTRVSARPIDDVMSRLEAVEANDWFPLGKREGDLVDENGIEVGAGGFIPSQWLVFAIAIDDIEWWVEHLSG